MITFIVEDWLVEMCCYNVCHWGLLVKWSAFQLRHAFIILISHHYYCICKCWVKPKNRVSYLAYWFSFIFEYHIFNQFLYTIYWFFILRKQFVYQLVWYCTNPLEDNIFEILLYLCNWYTCHIVNKHLASIYKHEYKIMIG